MVVPKISMEFVFFILMIVVIIILIIFYSGSVSTFVKENFCDAIDNFVDKLSITIPVINYRIGLPQVC